MIQIRDWTRSLAVGALGVVTLQVLGERPVVALDVDLLGDGLAAVTQVRGEDLRPVLALGFVPVRAGQLELQVRATDAAGCRDATGTRRVVEVR